MEEEEQQKFFLIDQYNTIVYVNISVQFNSPCEKR